MKRRPRIGLDLDFEHDGRSWIYKSPVQYLDLLKQAEALPVFLPPGDPRPVPEILDELDGFLMTGGDDFHPALLDREADHLPLTLLPVRRESFVLELARHLLEGDLPVLAVCLGCQALNLAAGGDLWIDLRSELPGCLEHGEGSEHQVLPEPGGLLDRCWMGEPRTLKSHHHQAVRTPGRGLALEARAEDEVIEAIRGEDHPFLLGVQWHPEVQPGSAGGLPLVKALVDAARGFR